MKIIDLLNKRANGEKMPKKIKFFDKIWVYKDRQYYTDGNGGANLWSGYNFNILNDEVEILEEEKKIPEKLEKYYDENLEEYVVETYIKGVNYKEIFNSKYDEMIISKLNEVLDYLKSKGDDKE